MEAISVEEDYYYTGSIVKVVVDFKGSEGYEMVSVNVNINSRNTDFSLVKINDTSYYFVAPSSSYSVGGGWCGNNYFIIKVLSATYGLADATTTIYTSSNTIAYGCGRDYGDVIDISTPEQLQNMQNGQSYKLTNDIDLQGVNWMPYAFTGKLDGNGFAIKNLVINQSYVEKSTSITDEYFVGLFTTCSGYITNLKMKNCKINVASKYQLGLSVGILAGKSYAYVSNCEIQGDVSVIVQNGNSSPSIDIGGFIGYGEACCYNCTFIGTVSLAVITSSEFTGSDRGAICGFRGDIANCISYSNVGEGWQTDVYNSYFYKLEEYKK